MKNYIFISLLIILVTSCNTKPAAVPSEQETLQDTLAAIPVIPKEKENTNYNFIKGNWVGDFIADKTTGEGEYVNKNKLNLIIQHISTENKVTGFSVVAGNVRPFEGDIIPTDSTLYVVLNEPGDNKYDGIFNFNISNTKDKISGTWTAFNKNLPAYGRRYELSKRTFIYNPKLMLPSGTEVEEEMDDYGYVDWYNAKVKKNKVDGEVYTNTFYRTATDAVYKINASTKLLKEKELKNLKKLDLEIIRNTIFARHGYTFKKKAVRQFFDWVKWYIPVSDDVSSKLTPIEKKNIALLQRFEKYATDNYDTFSR